MFEAAESFLFQFFFGEGPYSGIVGLVVFQEVPEDAREVDSFAVAHSALRA